MEESATNVVARLFRRRPVGVPRMTSGSSRSSRNDRRSTTSGGKSQLKVINKQGDTYLRTLLIHGARSVLRYAVGKTDVQSRWLQDLIARRGYNRAAAALANKNARFIQALLSSDVPYRQSAVAH